MAEGATILRVDAKPRGSRFTAPSTSGTPCHSSSGTGSARSLRAASGLTTNAAESSESSPTMLCACLAAVVVLPQARGPISITVGSSSTSLGI